MCEYDGHVSMMGMQAEKIEKCIFNAVSQTTKVLIEVSILSSTMDRVGHRDSFITEYERKLYL